MFHLATDVDNTIVDSAEVFNAELRRLFPDKDVDSDDVQCDYNRSALGITQDELRDIIRDVAKRGLYQTMKPMNIAPSFLTSFVSAGNKVSYISTRIPYFASEAEALESTRSWLEANNFPRGQIFVTNNDQEKVKKAMMIGAEVFVDDLARVATMLLDQTDVRPVIFTRAWNRGFRSNKVLRLESWAKMADLMYSEFGTIV